MHRFRIIQAYSVFFAFSCSVQQTITAAADSSNYTFALIPKDVSNPFFVEVFSGFNTTAKKLNIEALFVGPESSNATRQVEIINGLVDEGRVQGIAVSVIDPLSMTTVFERAIAAGIHVITFDSDALPGSGQEAYVASNNTEIGISMAKILLQLNPDGYKNGPYGMISDTTPNILERYNGFQRFIELHNNKFLQSSQSPKYSNDSTEIALEGMYSMLEDDPSIMAIISLGGWPMFNSTGWANFHDKYASLTYVVADTLDIQIHQLNQGYVNGLVGQLPFDMGELSLETLYNITQGNYDLSKTVQTVTNLVTVLRVPIDLPPPNYDYNFIDPWEKILGYILFGVCVLLSVGLALIVIGFRTNKVIVASQPFFLLMICFGSLLVASAILPLTVDDASDRYTPRGRDIACMCVPWFFFLGSTITFSALFSKTWRINKIFKSAREFRRIVVQPKDVLIPFVVLMVCSITLLLVWSVLDPWIYQRLPTGKGTDEWNRIVNTYGTCNSVPADPAPSVSISTVCYSLLWAILVSTLFAACWQAYQARSISTEYSESTYIGFAVALVLQILLLAAPIVVFVKSQPTAVYFAMLLVFGLTCCSVLLLIFVPKLLAMKQLLREEGTARPRHVIGNGVPNADARIQDIHRNGTTNDEAIPEISVPSSNPN